MAKRLKNLMGAIVFAGFLITAADLIFVTNINIDLSKASKITGQVINAGVSSYTTKAGGRFSVRSKVFCLFLDNSSEAFATYIPKQDYSNLIKAIKPGDIVTILFKKSRYKGFNLDVYQITKNGQTLQNYSSYNYNSKIAALMTGIAGLGILVAGIYPYVRKSRRKKAFLKRQQ